MSDKIKKTKKPLKEDSGDMTHEEQEQPKKVRAIKTTKNWNDKKESVDENADENNDIEEVVTDPDSQKDNYNTDDNLLQNKKDSIVDAINKEEVSKWDADYCSNLSDEQLAKILYVRSLKSRNPAVYHGSKRMLQELNFEPLHPRKPPIRRGSQFSRRGRGFNERRPVRHNMRE